MNVDFFISLLAFALVCLTNPCSPVAHAAPDLPAEIEKTFDLGTLIEHTVSVQRGAHRVSLRLSQRRASEDSVSIVGAHLAFYPNTEPGTPLLTVPIFESLLAEMMNALYGRFGADLKLDSLGAGSFMGIKEMEKKSILAFNGYAPWEQYLTDPDAFSQDQIYAIVQDRWKISGVFSAVTDAFAQMGYDATFSSFEKLFVFPAERCSFYPELEDLGIHRMDRFPYPGTISFSLTPKP
ncbi:hypothetical protein [Desulfosarcina sp.]|uniref:hypothetical protein n=1 Tax=Desulfosarcina sp. TaxID=2027861 RepID=UPI0035682D0D